MSLRPSSTLWPGLRWDDGIDAYTVIVDPPDPDELVMEVEYVRDSILRTAAGDIEDDVIKQYIRTATEACESWTLTAVMRQRRRLILSGTPAGSSIELPRPPFIRVVSIGYLDDDGESAVWGGSPLPYRVLPSGPFRRARLILSGGESWPTVYAAPDAFTVTFDCGYDDAQEVPSEIKTGIGLMVGELYKQRSLSVQGVNNHPSVLDLSRFWKRVY